MAKRQRIHMKRTTTHAACDGRDDFDIYIHDGSTSFRLEIEGSLNRKAARQLEQAWCTASSTIGNRALVVAVGDVRSI
jgi:hypothetical protein